jgi:hypothetical protein
MIDCHHRHGGRQAAFYGLIGKLRVEYSGPVNWSMSRVKQDGGGLSNLSM